MTFEKNIISSQKISVLSNKADIDFYGSLCSFCSLEINDMVDSITSERIENSELFEHNLYRINKSGDRLMPFMTITDFIEKSSDAFIRHFEGCDNLKLKLKIKPGIDYEYLGGYSIGDTIADCIFMHANDTHGMLAVIFGGVIFDSFSFEMLVCGNSGGIIFALGSKQSAVRTASSLIRNFKRSLKMAAKRELGVNIGDGIDPLYRSFIQSSVSYLRNFHTNQKLSTAEEYYFVIRAFCAMGLLCDAKRLLCAFHDRLCERGYFENTFTSPEFFSNTGAPAYFILSVCSYLSYSCDNTMLKSISPSIVHAAKLQIRARRHGLMQPSGSENEFVKGELPTANLYCASLKNTLLYIKSLKSAAALIPDEKELFADCAKKAESAFKDAFIKPTGAVSFARCSEFDRKTRFRAGFCEKCASMGRYTLTMLERSRDMRYLCDKCFEHERQNGIHTPPSKANTDILLPCDRCTIIASSIAKTESDTIEDYASVLNENGNYDALGILLLYCTKNKMPISKNIIGMFFEKMGNDALIFDGTSASVRTNAVLLEALAVYLNI